MLFDRRVEDVFLPHVTFHTRFARAQTSREVNNHLPHQCRKVLKISTIEDKHNYNPFLMPNGHFFNFEKVSTSLKQAYIHMNLLFLVYG